ncbi:MAG: phosphoglycerate dehydrogenase [Planctomycetes bacterium]|nr:phosphoglycerate dehydrogenase [Planctomycetota bacterium]
MTPKILIADGLAQEAKDKLVEAGFDVDFLPKITPDELLANIGKYDGVLVRSRTQMTREVIDRGKRLKVIGRAGVGVDNIDKNAATEKGVLVMNTPDGNTISAAEHAIAMMLSLARHIPRAQMSMDRGEWDRKTFLGVELSGKTVGIVGLGKIGRIVAKRVRGFDTTLLGYDPFLSEDSAVKLGIKLTSIDELCERSDFITIHTPLNDETRNLFDEKRLLSCKKGARIVNCARGGIVNETDLLKVLDAGHLAGAALDVYETEPPAEDSPLRHHPKVVCTPHLGASTIEAQENVAVDVAEQVVKFFKTGEIVNAINLPPVPPGTMRKLGAYIPLAGKLGKWLGQLVAGGVKNIVLEIAGEISELTLDPIIASFLQGFLTRTGSESANVINARQLADDRGITLSIAKTGYADHYLSLIRAHLGGEEGSESVAGTIFGSDVQRIVEIGGYTCDADPSGWIVLARYPDTPGQIGSIGTIFGSAGINIANMAVARKEAGKEAIAIIGVDTEPTAEVLAQIAARHADASVKKLYIEK